ncbi:FAD-dependent oxidoreductase [Kitasatospora sp. NBC_01302]|uniref:FAD-dependent oxidoreductase n=1 Tax=Kitasatospora sp. NBC_01302 TaxID=2903575 RepID=UPI003FA3B42C
MTSIAVVGGSLAGLSTVRALRAEGYDGSITVIGEERHHPYDRPPLSKGFLKGGLEAGALALGSSPSTGATGMTSPCSPSYLDGSPVRPGGMPGVARLAGIVRHGLEGAHAERIRAGRGSSVRIRCSRGGGRTRCGPVRGECCRG